VKRVKAVGAVTVSEHDTRGKVAYGEPPGIELHRTVVVTSEATNREKGPRRIDAPTKVTRGWNRCPQ
jgi:hypothetical protein